MTAVPTKMMQPAEPQALESLALTPATEAAMVWAAITDFVHKGASPEMAEKLFAMYERVAERKAAAEFAQAFSEFKRRCPLIPKDKVVDATGQRSGKKFAYKYADLPGIATIVDPILHALGFSYSFNTAISDKGQMVATCRLRHEGGHSEEASFTAPVGSTLPVSEQQKYAGANTYAKRYALIGVLGLVTTDEDKEQALGETITEEQAADLKALIEETKSVTKKVLDFAGVERVEDILSADLPRIVEVLEQRRRSQ